MDIVRSRGDSLECTIDVVPGYPKAAERRSPLCWSEYVEAAALYVTSPQIVLRFGRVLARAA
jgi:hypothetical protein